MDHPISAETATVIAAIVSAFFGLASVAISVMYSNRLAQNEAIRKLLYEDINKLGAELYHTVAISKKMLNSKSEEKFEELRLKAHSCRSQLNDIRVKVRYSLWGLDKGIEAIRSTPFYIFHYKNDKSNPIALKLIDLSTSLRRSLDVAILGALVSGRPPTLIRRSVVRFRVYRLERHFKKHAPVDYEHQA